ncbi:MAG: ComEC/Rec2 family competence protein [Sphaerochaetaceae bacterium]|nr:ComEC/Rec2 family competence protein [Sphaerochaetaceae bacterium]
MSIKNASISPSAIVPDPQALGMSGMMDSSGSFFVSRWLSALCRVFVCAGIPMLLLAINSFPDFLAGRHLVLSCGFAFCAVSFAFPPFVPASRLRCLCFWTMTICVLLYCQAGEVSWRTEVRAGMPLPRITAVEGMLCADSSISGKGNQVYNVVLDRCRGKDGSFASCRGTSLAVGRELPSHLSGVRLMLHGTFATGDDIHPGELFLVEDVRELPALGHLDTAGNLLRRIRRSCIGWIAGRLGLGGKEYGQLDQRNSSYHARLLAMMLLLGRCDDPAFPLKELSLTSGCAHVLALSGMHLQFFAGTVSWIGCRLLGRRRGRLFAVLPVLVFLFLAGPRPSLIRSAFMFFCTVLPLAVGREGPSAATAYTIAFLLQLFLFPHTVATAGCLFSYAALGGLLLVGGTFGTLYSRFMPRRAGNAWGTAFAAVLWSAPCSLLVFGYWSPVGLALSPVVGALIGLFMASSVLLLCTGCGTALGAVAVERCAVRLYRCLEMLLRWGSDVGGHTQKYSGAEGLSFYAFLLLTGSLAILYAGRVLRRRSIRRHELELCIRFPGGDHRVVE